MARVVITPVRTRLHILPSQIPARPHFCKSHIMHFYSVGTAQPGDRTTDPGIVMPERYQLSQRVNPK